MCNRALDNFSEISRGLEPRQISMNPSASCCLSASACFSLASSADDHHDTPTLVRKKCAFAIFVHDESCSFAAAATQP